MNSGGGGGGSTEQKPWGGLKPHLKGLYNAATGAFEGLPQDQFGGQLAVRPSDQTQQAIQGQTQYANQLAGQNLGQGAIDLGQATLRGDYLHPESNPYLTGAINAATRDVTRNFQENVLPGISNAAISQGAYGGTREGVASGVAGRGYLDTVGDISSQILYNNYANERALQQQAPGLVGQGIELGQAPYTLMQGAGQLGETYDQAQLDEARRLYELQRSDPFMGLQQYSALLQGGPAYTTTNYNGANNTALGVGQGALGGAVTGYMLGGPAGAGVGAASGGLLGLF